MILPYGTYLADEVEGNHITGLGDDRIRSEDELVVRANGDLHGGSHDSRALGKSSENNAGVHHVGGVG